MDNISIIIRNRNEQDFIGFAIQSCLDFFDKPEIIIVDNKSSDSSIQVVNLFSDRADIKIIHNESYTPGKSINLGINNSSNEYVMILSAHAQIKMLDFNIVKENLKKHSAIFGKQIPVYKGKKISPRYIWNHFGNKPLVNMFSDSEKRYFFHNAFSFFKKKTLIDFPFDEIHPGKEDRFWVQQLIENKGTYLYDPRLEINHFYTEGGSTWKGIG
jgi:glycosyltransferase involved in cell wall biosynthesis